MGVKRPRKKVEPFTIWVTQAYMHTDVPNISQYQAVSFGPTGAKVLNRAGDRFIVPAMGRKFFTDKEALVTYVTAYVREEAERSASRAKTLTEFLHAAHTEIDKSIVVVPHTPAAPARKSKPK